MRLIRCAALTAAILASSSLAAPSSDAHQHPYIADASQSASLMPAAPLFDWIHSTLEKVIPKKEAVQAHASALHRDPQYSSLERPDYSGVSIWEVIQRDEHLSDLKKVLKYSGPHAKELLDDKSKKLTFLAPVNWHHDKHDDAEVSQAGLKSSQWSAIESMMESVESSSKDDGDDDDEKKRRRKALAFLIDATLEYHCIHSEEPLKAWDVAQNSSVATRLSIGKGRAREVFGNLLNGNPFRLRVGKSLLPLPSTYFNFYSRLVYPDVSVGDGSLLHAVSLPLLIPPSALQTLYFSSPDLAATTLAFEKTRTEGYLRLPFNRTAIHHGHDDVKSTFADSVSMFKSHGHGDHGKHEHRHPRAPGHHGIPQAALTVFAPGNVAWYRLPVPFRLFLLSPFGERILGAILALHSVPGLVYADFVDAPKVHGKESTHTEVPAGELTSSPEWLWGPRSESPAVPFGKVDVTKYTFNTALPKIHFNHTHGEDVLAFATTYGASSDKIEFETVDVNVYRYKLLPGGRGPLQTRVSVQGVPVSFQDIAVANGALHVIERFIRPKEHPHKDIWAHVAAQAEKHGFGRVDMATASF